MTTPAEPQSYKQASPAPGSIPEQPEPPFPKQHLKGTGSESELEPLPKYQAEQYRAAGKLAGKVALITGGDSGIGRAVAVLYAREGADAAIVYYSHDEDAAETCAAVEAEGRRCISFKGDVGDPAFCKVCADETAEHLGQLDILVNNAAVQTRTSKIEQLSQEQLERTVRTNLYGYFSWFKLVCHTWHPAAPLSQRARKRACLVRLSYRTTRRRKVRFTR